MRKNISLPKVAYMPPVIRELMMNTHKDLHKVVLFAAIEPLMTLCTRVRAKYFRDSKPHMMLCQVIIVGPPSRGKSIARDIETLIMGKLRERDRLSYREEEEYKEMKKRSKKDKQLPPPPKKSVRYFEPTLTKLQIIKRCDRNEIIFGEPVTTHAFSEELGVVLDSIRSGRADLVTIMRLAFDGAIAGNDAASDDSYSGFAHICHNMMFLATPKALYSYMTPKAIEAGSTTRPMICTMPGESEFDDELPPMTELSAKQLGAVNGILDKIMDDTYESSEKLKPTVMVDMDFLTPTIRNWLDDVKQDAELELLEVKAMYRKRASVNAFRCAATCKYLYQLEGKVDERTVNQRVRRIYLYIADSVLDEMMRYWADIHEKMLQGNVAEETEKGRLIDMLDDVFTRQDIVDLMVREERSSPARIVICRWKQRGYIREVSDGMYQKTEKGVRNGKKNVDVGKTA